MLVLLPADPLDHPDQTNSSSLDPYNQNDLRKQEPKSEWDPYTFTTLISLMS